MKLSEAMMLGSTTCKMQATNWNTCAMGAAANAVGVPQGIATARLAAIKKIWPWLKGDSADANFPRFGPAHHLAAIWRRFDNRVVWGEMTLEQLVDYVRSIEPECGECNRFECSCVKPSVEQSVSGVELKEKVSK